MLEIKDEDDEDLIIDAPQWYMDVNSEYWVEHDRANKNMPRVAHLLVTLQMDKLTCLLIW